jgi:hypothetical protein
LVPRILDGMLLVTRLARRRAMVEGSAEKAPSAQPKVSTNVRFTWWTTSGGKSWYVSLQA